MDTESLAEVLRVWLDIQSWSIPKLVNFIIDTAGMERFEIQRHFAQQALNRQTRVPATDGDPDSV